MHLYQTLESGFETKTRPDLSVLNITGLKVYFVKREYMRYIETCPKMYTVLEQWHMLCIMYVC